MEEFIGEKVKIEYKQKLGWRYPVSLTLGNTTHKIKKIILRWEEHTKEKYWRDRKHRVWYQVLLDDGKVYQLYWDRGAYGKRNEWILLKKI